MTEEEVLLKGREFEVKVFGLPKDFWEVFGPFRQPEYLDFESSMQEVIELNNGMYAEALAKGYPYCHNPENPRMGRTHDLWAAVKNWLPRRIGSDVRLPLFLYVAVGRNAFDRYHGVDAFFWWRGVSVTIDVSTSNKKCPSADFVFTPRDYFDSRLLSRFGKKVADLLVTKSLRK